MKANTNSLTIDEAISNTYSLYLAYYGCGQIHVTYYDMDNQKHEALCNDIISYDRYRELRDSIFLCEHEQEFVNLYKYFLDLCD